MAGAPPMGPPFTRVVPDDLRSLPLSELRRHFIIEHDIAMFAFAQGVRKA